MLLLYLQTIMLYSVDKENINILLESRV